MQHVRVFITREEKAGKLNLTDKEPKHVNYFIGITFVGLQNSRKYA